MSKLLLADLTHEIIGAGMAVHSGLGNGFSERVYENALVVELDERGLSWQQQVPVTVLYKGRNVGDYYTDLVVEGKVVVELKAISMLVAAHSAQLLNYLAATGLRVGLLLNFGENRLSHKRIIK